MGRKVAIFGDVHHGGSSPDNVVERKTCEFWEKVAFPYCEKHGIHYGIQLGDLTHNRRAIYTQSAKNIVDYYVGGIERLNQSGHPFEMYQIIGNHDCYYNDGTSLNTPAVLLDSRDHIHVVPDYLFVPELKADLFSWGTSPVNHNRGRFAFGHFDIINAMMNGGIYCKKGYDLDSFSTYDRVFSGHYHNKSEIKNVVYVGTVIPQNFGERNSQHGFYVLDVETGEFEFVHHDLSIFEAFSVGSMKEVQTLLESRESWADKVLNITIGSDILTSEIPGIIQMFTDKGAITTKVFSLMNGGDAVSDTGSPMEFLDFETKMKEFLELKYKDNPFYDGIVSMFEKFYNEVKSAQI